MIIKRHGKPYTADNPPWVSIERHGWLLTVRFYHYRGDCNGTRYTTLNFGYNHAMPRSRRSQSAGVLSFGFGLVSWEKWRVEIGLIPAIAAPQSALMYRLLADIYWP